MGNPAADFPAATAGVVGGLRGQPWQGSLALPVIPRANTEGLMAWFQRDDKDFRDRINEDLRIKEAQMAQLAQLQNQQMPNPYGNQVNTNPYAPGQIITSGGSGIYGLASSVPSHTHTIGQYYPATSTSTGPYVTQPGGPPGGPYAIHQPQSPAAYYMALPSNPAEGDHVVVRFSKGKWCEERTIMSELFPQKGGDGALSLTEIYEAQEMVDELSKV